MNINIEWTRRLDYCLKSPWWHYILVSPAGMWHRSFNEKKISHYKTVYNDLYFVVLVDTVGNLKDVTDIFVFLVGMQMEKKNYQGKLQHCAKWYPWNYSAAYNSWTFKIECAYILPFQFIILSFDLWYTSFNFRIRVYITPLSFRENKIWSTD